jgi:hypothetical protein
MFVIPRANVIESDEGFSVEVLGRTGMKYREGDRSLSLYSEVLATGYGIAIWTRTISQWDPPHDGEPIGPEKKAVIVDNIKRAMEFRKAPLQIMET